jgi:hypothetical protein
MVSGWLELGAHGVRVDAGRRHAAASPRLAAGLVDEVA